MPPLPHLIDVPFPIVFTTACPDKPALPFYDCPAIRARGFEDLSAYLGPPNASRREIASTCHRACRRTMHLSGRAFRCPISSPSLPHLRASRVGANVRGKERRVLAEREGEQINWRLNTGGNCRLDGLNRPWMRDEAVPKSSRCVFSDQVRKAWSVLEGL